MSTAVLTEVVVVEVAEHVGVVLTALLLVILLVIGGSILAGGLRLLVEGQVKGDILAVAVEGRSWR